MKGKILLVDDQESNLRLLERLLRPEGYEVVKVKNGKEAMETLEKENVDMLLLDILMPGISGFALLKIIREKENWQTLPVLLITGLGEKEDRIKGISLGADDFISKPFDRDELLARVNTQMKLAYLRRQLNEKDKLLKIIEQMAEGVIITDRNYKPISINRKAKELLEIGNAPENILSYLENKFTCPISKDYPHLYSSPRVGEERGEGISSHFLLQRQETEHYNPLYLSCTIQPVKNPASEIDSFIIFFRDVTEEYLEEHLRYDFLSLISHKLRTPLTIISQAIDILQLKIKEENLKTLLEKTEKQTNRLDELIKRLLYFINIEKEDLQKTVKNEEVETLLQSLKNKYPSKNLELEKNITIEEIPLYRKIILEEILDNACKFSTGETVKISLSLTNEKMEVADNGPGIPPEEKEKIFEPFYQIEKYFTGQIPGAGLGLTLVKRLSEIFHGRIEIDSQLNKGTQIEISFSNESE